MAFAIVAGLFFVAVAIGIGLGNIADAIKTLKD